MKNFEKLFKNGQKALKKKNFSKAIKCYLICLDLYPNSSKVLQDLALIYNRKKLYSKAIDIGLSILKKEPLNEKTLNNLFFAYDQKGNYEEALKVLKRYIEVHPITLEPPLNVHEDIIFYSYDEFVIKSDPKHWKKFKNLDYLDRRRSYIKEILPDIDPSFIIPINFFYNFQFSNIINSTKKIDVLNLILIIFPQKIRTLNELGLTYSNLKDYNKAIETFKRSLEIDTNVFNNNSNE